MGKSIISTKNAPAPLPQFSQGTTFNGFIYTSGQIGNEPNGTGRPIEGTIKDRARQALRNIFAVLEAAGSGPDKIMKVNVYLTDMANFGAFNEVWDEFFTMQQKPARTCVAVAQLPLGTDVEVEATAIGPQAKL